MINMFMIRRKRDQMLSASDWTQIPGSPLSKEEVSAWASYRQALRDLPKGLSKDSDKEPAWPEYKSPVGIVGSVAAATKRLWPW